MTRFSSRSLLPWVSTITILRMRNECLSIYLLFCGLAALGSLHVQAEEPLENPTGDTLRLALMRSVPEKWNLESNYRTFLRAADAAAEKRADLLITPECWLDGYASPDEDSTPQRIRGIAQDAATSRYLRGVAEKAREHRQYICFGFTSLEDDKAYNAAGLWDRTGNCIGVYHKTHLQSHDLQYAGGDSLPVWKSPWGPLGIMICADRRWPETARTLRLKGARLILNPTYGFYNDLNEAMLRTRAFENQCFIAFAHPLQSLVTGPGGDVVAKETSSDKTPGPAELLICDIDLSRAKEDNHLRDRRPSLYKIITAPTQ